MIAIKRQFPYNFVTRIFRRSLTSHNISLSGRLWLIGAFCLGIGGLTPVSLRAQVSIADSAVALSTIDVHYRGVIPAGIMGERWGYTSALGLEFGHKFKNNIFLTAGLSPLFSESIDIRGVLDPLLVGGGFFVADNGIITGIRAIGTGWLVPIQVGKIFPFGPTNPNSGIVLAVGLQYLHYRFGIRAQEESVAGLAGEYRKGYDRLTTGLGFAQRIGYRFFSNRGDVNFTAGFEFSQNFTQNRRSIHFSTGPAPSDTQLDLLLGFYAAWTFPIYERAPNKTYYY